MSAPHGTLSSYRSGCHGDCCRAAKRRYDNLLRLDALHGVTRTVDPAGTVRRIQALQWMGWTHQDIADRAGWQSFQAVARLLTRRWVTPATADAIRAAYDELSMTPGPSTRGARRARRLGYLPPLSWDDDKIDDPSARPVVLPPGLSHDVIDDVVVERVLAGDWTPQSTSKGTKVEVIRRWRDSGRPLSDLERLTGWRASGDRYDDRAEAA